MALKDLIKAVHGPSELIPSLDVHLRKLEAKPSNRADGWHPSAFCGSCARHEVLTQISPREFEPFTVDPKLRRIFDVGTQHHDWFQNEYLGPMGILWGRWQCSRCHDIRWGFMPEDRCGCAELGTSKVPSCAKWCLDKEASDAKGQYVWNELAIEERGGCRHCATWGQWLFKEVPIRVERDDLEKPIVGHSDGLLKLEHWTVFEMKSINDRGFGLLPEARDHHRNQAEIYGHLIQRGYVHGVPEGVKVPIPTHGMVFYANKNNSDLKEFPFKLDEERGRRLCSYPLIVEQAFRDEELPARHPDCKNIFADRAKKCEVQAECFGNKKTWKEIQNG